MRRYGINANQTPEPQQFKPHVQRLWYSLQQWTVAHPVWQSVYGPRQSVKTCGSVTILHIFYNLFTDCSSSSESNSDFSSIIDCDFKPSQIFTSRKRKRPVQFDYVDSEDDNLEVKRCKY
jgi:hypothetical protein